MGAVPFRAAYQPQPSASKMKFLIIACLALSAVAEPEPQHQTSGFVRHLNGAVVPTDTTSVLDQKALHGAAHATAAVNGYKFPLVYGYDAAEYDPVVKPDDRKQPAQPTLKDIALSPLVDIAMQPKRVALQYNTYSYPYTYGLHHPVTYGVHYPTYGVHHLGKREAEAEAEADPAVLYANHYGTYAGYPYATYGYPYSTYGFPWYFNVPRVVAPKTDEGMKVVTPDVKTVPHVYGYPFAYTYPNVPKVVAPETKTVSGVTATVPHVYGHPLTYTYTGGRYNRRPRLIYAPYFG